MKDVYQLADLADRPTLDAGAEAPARLAIIGHPVAHSASPPMQQAALDAAGIPARYIRLEVEPGQVARALERMQALGFIGCNVTVPHKLEVMECCATISAEARALGAVNTVRFDAAGPGGWNTDGPGFSAAVKRELGLGLAGLRVAIVGAGGGAGRALAAQCALEGVAELTLINRTLSKLTGLGRDLDRLAPEMKVRRLSLDDPGLAAACLAGDLIVNASSAGLRPGDPTLLGADCFPSGGAFYDCNYHPPVTALMESAARAGCRTANGFSMLLHQGVLAFQLWFPGSDPLPAMEAALGGGK